MAEKRPRDFISPEARHCIDRRLHSLQESLLYGQCSDSHLSLCAKWLSRKHFMDVCVERAVSSGLCCWPGCGNEVKKSKGKVKISLNHRRIEEIDKWGSNACSSDCRTLSQAFLKSVSATSPYTRDMAMAYLNENENKTVVESIRRLNISNEPVLMEVKERPQTAAVVQQSITADISFSVAAPTIKMYTSAPERWLRKSNGEDGTLSKQRPEGVVGESDDEVGEDYTVVDVESDAAIWREVLNSEMPDYLGVDTDLLDHECFTGDNSNHPPLSTFIVLWKAFTEWQPLEMEDSSCSTKTLGSASAVGLSTSKQRAEVLSSMVLRCLTEVALVLVQDKRDDDEDCLCSRIVIGGGSASTRIPQIHHAIQDHLAALVSSFSMSSEIPDLNQDQWHLVTWVLLYALYSPALLQRSKGILGQIALKHIEGLGVSCDEFFILVKTGKDLVTTWGG